MILSSIDDHLPVIACDVDPLPLCVGEREAVNHPSRCLADDPGDLLPWNHRIALGVHIVNARRDCKRQIGLGDQQGFPVLPINDAVELTSAIGCKIDNGVVAVIGDQDRPLLANMYLRHDLNLSKKTQ